MKRQYRYCWLSFLDAHAVNTGEWHDYSPATFDAALTRYLKLSPGKWWLDFRQVASQPTLPETPTPSWQEQQQFINGEPE